MKPSMKDYIFEQDSVITDVLNNVPREISVNLPKNLGKLTKIILIGSGTSYNAIIAAKYMFNALLPYFVEISNPFDFNKYYPKNKINQTTLVIGVSQTARSTGVIEAIEISKSCSARTLFVTGNPQASGCKSAESVIYTWTGEEKVGPKTKGFTSTIATLYLLATALSKQSLDLSNSPRLIKDTISISFNMIEEFTTRFFDAGSLTIIGYGPNMAAAQEGGLKISETVRIPVEVYNVEEYMHGPYHCLDNGSHLICIASPGIGQARMNELICYLEKKSPHVVVITDDNNSFSSEKTLVLRLNSEIDEALSPLCYVIPLQLFAYELTRKLGRKPEESGHPDFHATLGSKKIAK
jgi:glucosamine 6-phosphate synthetase-like amidotransferase/phosphosugar isomerase protein